MLLLYKKQRRFVLNPVLFCFLDLLRTMDHFLSIWTVVVFLTLLKNAGKPYGLYVNLIVCSPQFF